MTDVPEKTWQDVLPHCLTIIKNGTEGQQLAAKAMLQRAMVTADLALSLHRTAERMVLWLDKDEDFALYAVEYCNERGIDSHEFQLELKEQLKEAVSKLSHVRIVP